MKPIEFHTDAVEEYDESEAFYEGRKPDLGDDFVAAVQAATREIQQLPQSFPIHRRPVRAYTMQRFPFAIFYTEYDDVIFIHAIYHNSRQPDTWLNRQRDD